MKAIKKSILIEIPIDSTTQLTFKVPNQPFLATKKVVGFAASSLLSSPTTSRSNFFAVGQIGSTIDANSTFLTLVDNNEFKFIDSLPMVEYCNTSYLRIDAANPSLAVPNGNYQYLCSNQSYFGILPRVISWSKCSIYTAIPITVTAYSFLINIFYED